MSGLVTIIGGGVAGATAARTLAAGKHPGPIHLFCEESVPPYSRPKMIDYLRGTIGRERLSLFPASWYAENGVTLHLGTDVTSLDPGNGIVAWDGGKLEGCSTFIMATGAESRRLPVPGADGGDVVAWRTVEDADRILRSVDEGKEFAVVGGGVLGVETAMAIASRGAKVSILQYTDRLMDVQLDGEAAAILDGFVRQAGVATAFGVDTSQIAGGFVEAKDGRRFAAGTVVLAAGVRSRTSLAAAAGLKIERGVVIDDRCRTSHSAVYACGDCAQFNGEVYGIVPAAAEQARIAAANIAAEGSARYAGTIPSNTLKVAGLPLLSAGLHTPKPGQEAGHRIVVRSDPERDVYLKAVLRESRVVGAIWLGTEAGAGRIGTLVTKRAEVTEEELRGIMEESLKG